MKRVLAIMFAAALVLCACADSGTALPEAVSGDITSEASVTSDTEEVTEPTTVTEPEPPETSVSAEDTEVTEEEDDADEIGYSDDGFPFSEPADLDDEDFVYSFSIDETSRPLAETLLDNVADQNKKLYDFVTDDFDLDGRYEAFAVLGEFNGAEIAGDIYFVTESGAEKINGEKYYLGTERYPVFDLGDRKLYRVWHVFTTGRSAYVYGVKDGKWYEHEISQRGQDLERMGRSDNFTIVNGGDYDSGYFAADNATSGRTWKTYYLYWNGEEFREYGGIEISKEQFLKCEGAQHILDLAEENDCFVSNILYRGNGLINVNLTDRDFYGNEDYYYFSLILEDGKLEYFRTLQNSYLRDDEFRCNTNSGIMYPAFLEDIADYPESFPIE